ncbi:MAG: alkaline phosphatase [Chitinophagales bacterium]
MCSKLGLGKTVLLIALIWLFLGLSPSCNTLAANSGGAAKPSKQGPKYILIVVGDGMGSVQRQLAEEMMATYGSSYQLAMNQLTVQGTMTTNSLSGTTDSLAAATAMYSGKKTRNGLFMLSPNGTIYPNVFNAAKKAGWSTGYVTSVPMGQNLDRISSGKLNLEHLLGIPYLATVVDLVFVTEGKTLPSTSLKVLELLKNVGYQVAKPGEDYRNIAINCAKKQKKLIGLVYNGDQTFEIDRTQPFADMGYMTESAIKALSSNPRGFLLVVQGTQIDKANHNNDLAAQTCEVISLDRAVRSCLRFQQTNPQDTLLIVTGDHETGGITITGKDASKRGTVIKNVKASIPALTSGFESLKSEPDKMVSYLESMGIGQLNDREKSRLGIINNEVKTSQSLSSVLAGIICSRAGVKYTTRGHSNSKIPISACGPESETFKGEIDNTDMGKMLLKIINKNAPKTVTPKSKKLEVKLEVSIK